MGGDATEGALGPKARAERVKALARSVGFDHVGVAPTAAEEAHARYVEAMNEGFGADMAWLHPPPDRPELRADVRHVHPEARSVVALAVSYASDGPSVLVGPPEPGRGWIAKYAQGRDYHDYVRKLLVRFVRALADDPELGGGLPSTAHRVFVDTGPVLEKAFAARAGLGWIGKNSLLLTREHGSWVFLAVVLTPLELEPDAPTTDHCGTCRACLDVCPTDAFPEPRVLDARRCIAHWTIEADRPADWIDLDALGPHVFGCDLCQDVCPWNRKAPETGHAALKPRPDNVWPPLDGLGALEDQAAFKARFPNSAVRRVDVDHLKEVIAAVRAGPGMDG